jgi:hypothetical protein
MARPTATSTRPRPIALILLAVAGLAAIATSATPPVLESRATGDVAIGGGTAQTRNIRIHLALSASDRLKAGALSVGLRSAADFGPAYTDAVDVAIQGPAGQPIPRTPGDSATSIPLPVELCASGCDLAYRLVFVARDDVGPGATIRFESIVRFEYDYSASPDPAGLIVQVEGQDGGTALPVGWLGILAAGLLGVIIGAFVGRRLRMAGRARIVPAAIVIGLLVVGGTLPLAILAVYTVMPRAFYDPLRGYDSGVTWPYPGGLAGGLLAAALLLALGVALAVGLRRWPRDGGWLLGLAAVSTVALGGVWLGWTVGSFAVLQPAVMAILVAILGLLLGAIVGQTWGVGGDEVAGRRLWPSVAVISQGFLASGLWFFALSGIDTPGPRGPDPVLLVPLVGLVIVAAGTWRWFRGSRWLMILTNLVLSVIGVLGAFLYSSLVNGFGGADSDSLPFLGFVYLEVAAAIAGLVASTQAYGGPVSPSPSGVGDADMAAVDAGAPVLSGMVSIPTGAVQERDGRAVVFVVDGNRAVLRGVSPRPLGPDRVSVNGGVAPGEMVVVEAPAGLTDNARIRVK